MDMTHPQRRVVRFLATAVCTIVAVGALTMSVTSASENEPGVGDPAPAFKLVDQDGTEVSLAEFKGESSVLLAFYPKDFSRVCTTEMTSFRQHQSRFESHGVKLLALSGDDAATHARFAKTLGLKFPLLADAKLAIAKTYGVHVPSPTGGVAMRSVFLIDKDGILRHVDRDYRVARELEGTPLFAAIDALGETIADPFAALAELPELEREGKTLLGRVVLAVLAEDADAVDALLHKRFRAMPGEDDEAVAARRKAFLDLCRATFEAHDLSGKSLTSVLRLRDTLVLERDAATGKALKTFRSKVRMLAAGLARGDVMVAVRGRGLYGEGGATVLARELAIVMRKEGETWKIAELSGR